MIQIIADTTCGIPVEKLKAQGIHVLPQIIIFGETTYHDDYELDTQTFMEKLLASKELPKTAAPPPTLYAPIYESILSAGDTALVIAPSQKLSGTFRSASVAAEEFHSEDIHIIDTKSIAGGLGSMVLQAKQWADEGMDIHSLLQNLESMMARERVYFMVDTLDYLYKGGRIGGASRLIGSMLQIKPILTFIDGQIEPFDKVRTASQALANIVEMDIEICKGNPGAHLTISHGGAESQAKLLAAELQDKLDLPDIPIYTCPPAIVVHASPGVISTSCFVKPN